MGLLLSVLFVFGCLFPVFVGAQGAPFPPVPVRSGGGLNPDISLDGLFAAGYFSKPENRQFGAHDPKRRGFTLQNLELTVTENVDPYFRAEGHLIFGLEGGESIVEVEEAFFTTLGLPYRLQVMAGQFFTRFGRQNPRHPHAWDFADQTLVNAVMFGGDGLRNLGVQVSTILPLPLYVEMIGSLQNADGETALSFLSVEGDTFAGRPIQGKAVRKTSDLLAMGRLILSADLRETVTGVFGFSRLSGPNGSGNSTETVIHGVDLFLKWKPLMTDHGWPFATLQGEAMRRCYEAGAAETSGGLLPEERFTTDGYYLQAAYGFTRRWVAAVRYGETDATEPSDPRTGRRRRAAFNITFYPSEFSKLRLQYNHDRLADSADPIHALFFQWEFLVGPHGAHTF